MNPFPRDLGEVLHRYAKVLVPELNLGQLAMLLRARFLKDIVSLTKVRGQPFTVAEIVEAVKTCLAGRDVSYASVPQTEEQDTISMG